MLWIYFFIVGKSQEFSGMGYLKIYWVKGIKHSLQSLRLIFLHVLNRLLCQNSNIIIFLSARFSVYEFVCLIFNILFVCLSCQWLRSYAQFALIYTQFCYWSPQGKYMLALLKSIFLSFRNIYLLLCRGVGEEAEHEAQPKCHLRSKMPLLRPSTLQTECDCSLLW